MTTRGIATLLAMMTFPASLWAVDGVVLINQTIVMAAGGFPYTITQRGSYKLSGNLVLPSDTHGIVIASDNVTIDLNGFAIIGLAECAGGPLCGVSPGNGHGIIAGTDAPAKSYRNLTVRNGTIRGMGRDGVHLLANSVLVEYLHVHGNLLSGIVVRSTGTELQTNLILRFNNIDRNGSYGIKAYAGLITDNSISESGHAGISVQQGGAMVARNFVTAGAGVALSLTPSAGYVSNTLTNNGAGVQVFGGVNLGQNLCDSAVCP
jgi:hypothetical protein